MLKDFGRITYCSDNDLALLETQPDVFWRGVESIGRFCFAKSNIQEIVIPDSVKDIEREAFSCCRKLTKVIMPSSITVGRSVFVNCEALQFVQLPQDLQVIPMKAFYNCSSIQSIKIPNSVHTIEFAAFHHCTSLAEVVLPDNILEIGENAFDSCEKLNKVVMPSHLKKIRLYAFANCQNLESIDIPQTVNLIDNFAFQRCKSLKHIEIPSGVSLGAALFQYCSSLKSVKLPKDLLEIKRATFYQCFALEQIDLPKTLTKIDNSAFECCKSLKEITIPAGVRSISKNAFRHCDSLSTVVLPNGLLSITHYAFANCGSLKRLTIPSSVEQIKLSAFDDTSMRYFYKSKGSKDYQVSTTRPDLLNVEFCFDFDVLRKCFMEQESQIDIMSLIKTFDKDAIKLVNVLYKEKVCVPYDFIEQKSPNELKDFVNNGTFRFIKSDPQIFKTAKELLPTSQMGFYKFLESIGCFSTQKYLDKNQQETNSYLAQRATSFVSKYVKNNKTCKFFGFAGIEVEWLDKQKVLEFLSRDIGDNTTVIEYLQKLEDLAGGGIIDKILVDIDGVYSFRRTFVDGKPVTRTIQEMINAYLAQKMYSNVSEENADIANLFASQGIDEILFQTSTNDRRLAISKGVPEHILGKSLRESTVLEEVESIRKQTELALEQSQQLLDKAFDRKFSYEWLSKRDPKNFVLGAYCSCCASITSVFYGSTIARSSVIAHNVQNLVVRDASGEIVAKAAFYVNKKHGYMVANDIEINDKYKNHEELCGKYNVPPTHPEEIQREKIFQAFMRGVRAFITEYDEQNPDNPIKNVTVGGGFNRLKRQTTRYEKVKPLFVPDDYSFEDAQDEQYLLYSREIETEQQVEDV